MNNHRCTTMKPLRLDLTAMSLRYRHLVVVSKCWIARRAHQQQRPEGDSVEGSSYSRAQTTVTKQQHNSTPHTPNANTPRASLSFTTQRAKPADVQHADHSFDFV